MKKLITILVLAVICFYHINPVLAANTHSIDLEKDSSQYLSITDANQTGLDLSGSCTIEFWIKVENLSTTMYPITKQRESTDQRGYLVEINTDGHIQFFFTDSGSWIDNSHISNAISATGVVVVDEWAHFAGAFNSSTKVVTIYKNGSPLTPAYSNSNISSIYNNSEPFLIGADGGGTQRFTDGLIDEVRVWSDVRTPTEISDNYQKELVGNEANLVGYWKLNNSLLDETSNNNDLTNNNSAVFSSDVPFTEEEETFIPQILIY